MGSFGMASFVDLPREMVDEIISYLDSLDDMESLALSCRRLYDFLDIKNRQLFHRIPRIGLTEIDPLLLLQRIIDQPNLRFYIREIHDVWVVLWGERQAHRFPKNLDALIPYLEATGLNDGECQIILSGLKSPTDHRGFILRASPFSCLLATALLSLSPNLRKLTIANLDANSPLAVILRRINDATDCKRPSFLQDLEEVDIDKSGLEPLTLFHRLPNIHTFSIRFIDEFIETGLVAGSSNIRKIHLRGPSWFSSAALAGVIRHPVALEEFVCHTGVWTRPDFNPEEFKEALLARKDTLRVLDLTLLQNCECSSFSTQNAPNCVFGYWFDIIRTLKEMSVLSQFGLRLEMTYRPDQITTIFPPWTEFAVAQSLPPNLQYFQLISRHRTFDYHFDQISRLLEREESVTPALKEIKGLDGVRRWVYDREREGQKTEILLLTHGTA